MSSYRYAFRPGFLFWACDALSFVLFRFAVSVFGSPGMNWLGFGFGQACGGRNGLIGTPELRASLDTWIFFPLAF
jgi:hypothetical protein